MFIFKHTGVLHNVLVTWFEYTSKVHERRVYESVDDRNLLWIMSQNRRKVEFKKQKLYLLTNTGKPAFSLCPLITKNLTIKERTAKLLIPKQKKNKEFMSQHDIKRLRRNRPGPLQQMQTV